jgi:hypothetical protein
MQSKSVIAGRDLLSYAQIPVRKSQKTSHTEPKEWGQEKGAIFIPG